MARLKNFFRLFQRDKFPFKFVYSEEYCKLDLKNHVFPVEKYRLVYEKLLSMRAKKEDFLLPRPASEEDILLVHTSKYVKKLKSGKLSLFALYCSMARSISCPKAAIFSASSAPGFITNSHSSVVLACRRSSGTSEH